MEQHVMIDLETLGVGREPVILSIGAVKFDGTDILDEFHVGIDPATCQEAGLMIDAGTVLWWLDNDRAVARQSLLTLLDQKVDIASALYGFRQWYGEESLPTWSNGATADLVWMQSAFSRLHGRAPWSYKHERCYRTLRALAPGVEVPSEGVAHDALADARFQAKHLQAIWRSMERGFPPAELEEAKRLIGDHARQFRVYQANHERKGQDISLGERARQEALGKAGTNQRLAEEAETFLERHA